MSDLHTPGPWFVAETDDNEGYPETVIRGMDGVAGIAVAIDFQKMPGMREANARMIAASPDLFEALLAITDQLERIGDTRHHKDGQYIEAARAALAKATQEASHDLPH